MSAPIPSCFKIRFVLVILSLLLFFMLIGMARRALAVDCTDYGYDVNYYTTVVAARAARDATVTTTHRPFTTRSYVNNYWYLCYKVPPLLDIYASYHYESQPDGSNIEVGFAAVFDPSCEDSDGDGNCECGAEKESLASQCGAVGFTVVDEGLCKVRCNDCVQSAEEQCGSNSIEWNEDGDCSYRCLEPCQDLNDRLSYDCGGSDKIWLEARRDTDSSGTTTEQCAGGCGSPPNPNSDTDRDGIPDNEDDDLDGDGIPNDQDDDQDGDGIPNDNDSSPTTPGGVDLSKPPGKYGDQNPDADPSTDPDKPDPTFDCIEQYNNKVKECGDPGIASWNNDNCTGRCNGSNPCTQVQMDAADSQCPKGYTMNSDCTASCKTCAGFESDCIESCKPAAVKTNFCEEQNGTVVDTLCECENASGCQQYKSSCDAACAQDNCGGVKTYQCQEDSTGKITSKTCDCNDCGKPKVPDPKNPEPPDNSDITGWLKGIKRDTEQIAGNTAAIEQSVDGLKGSVDGLKNALSDVTMKGSGIGTLTGDGSLGTGGSVTGSGYGTGPADGDIPGTTSFGTFTPRGPTGDYGGQISATLNTLSIIASGAVCSFNFSYPVPRFSGLSVSFTWQNFLVDFCPYESLFVALGNIFVFFTALSELYKFA